jgi:hypothetical protein
MESDQLSIVCLSKNTYECPLCQELKHAHEFSLEINSFAASDARLFCGDCLDVFNAMPNRERSYFLRSRFEAFYGAVQYIYGLVDPNTNLVRYIGRTKDLKKRFREHLRRGKLTRWRKKLPIICECYEYKSPVPSGYRSKSWIADLARMDKVPILQVLETVKPGVFVCEREMRWVSYQIQLGVPLLNVEDSSENVRNLVRGYDESFLTLPMEQLVKDGFVDQMYLLCFEYGLVSGWNRAKLIYDCYDDTFPTLFA